MNIKHLIETKLQSLCPVFLEVTNESGKHNVSTGSESHFKVIVVSDQFDGKRLVARHHLVNRLLVEELAHSIHALALHTLTAEEWSERCGKSSESPPCLGGSKAK